MKKKILFYLFIFPLLLFGQWSNDPAENNAICDLTGEQAIPKVVTSPTGDTYISWFSNDSGNYDVRLQRLDAEGNEIWDHNGLLISDNPAMSWLTDWDMTVDQENHAILTFQDIRNAGNNNIYAYRISPDGSFIWGDSGLELSNSTTFDASPKVTVTSNNNSVIAWSAENVIILQKISPDGDLLWGDNGITISGTNDFTWPQLLPSDNDAILLKYFEDSGLPYAPTRHVFIQKFDSDGNPVWMDPTIVSEAGGISAWTQIFSMVPDENNGCYIAWHDDRDNDMDASCFVQHINSDGSVSFTQNGLELSLQQNSEKFYPEIVFQESDDIIYISWYQTDSDQNNYGISAQKIDATGNRIWGDNGATILPVSPLDVLPFAARKAENDFIIFYLESSSALNSQTKAIRIDAEGNFVWNEQSVTLSSVLSEKVHSVASKTFMDQIIVSWEDDRNGNRDIFAQNINLDGTLGTTIPVFLTSFTGEVISTGIDINWSTYGEPNLIGWNIWRSEITAQDSFLINTGLIPATGSPSTAADYEFLDNYDLEMDHTYSYWLESILEDTTSFYFGPVNVELPIVLNPPLNVNINFNTGFVSWELPEPYPGAELVGYNLYLDGNFIGLMNQMNYTLQNLINGQLYTLGISAVYEQGESDIITAGFIYNGTDANDYLISVRKSLRNYPNPFNPSTTIVFSLTTENTESTEIIIYNLKGQKIRTLECIDCFDTASSQILHSIVWNGHDENDKPVSSGVYFYQLEMDGKPIASRKMLLVK